MRDVGFNRQQIKLDRYKISLPKVGSWLITRSPLHVTMDSCSAAALMSAATGVT